MHVLPKTALAAAAAGALVAAAPGTASAALTNPTQIVASDPSASAHFGSAIDVSSDGIPCWSATRPSPAG